MTQQRFVSKIGDIKASDDEMKFRLLVKLGTEPLLDVVGVPRTRRAITMADLKQVPEAEALIEKLVGVRVHILQEVEGE